MSDPAWINAGKASTAIGTATITAVDDTFTLTAHGLGDGDTVTVDTLTGGAVGVLVADAVYFVRDATADTFTLSLTVSGPVVDFASDGGADVYSFAPQYTAAELRRLFSGLLWRAGNKANFEARSGVFPQGGLDNQVTVSGTTWTVENLNAVVDPIFTSLSGPYVVQHPSESGSLDPADGASDRIDALDLQIQDDDEDSSGFRRARIVYVAGTPGSGVRGAATANSLELATILVPAAGTPSPSVSTQAVFTVAAGGIAPVRDDTELPTSGRWPGLAAYRRDTGALEVWDGAAWVPIAGPGLPTEDRKGANVAVTDTTYTATADPAQFTFAAPASGVVRVDQSDEIEISGGVSDQNTVIFASYEVREGATIGAGAIVTAASDDRCVKAGSRHLDQIQTVTGATFSVVTGLSPGSTYNIRTVHKRDDATTPHTTQSLQRVLIVTPQF